jgi:magnesium chelatase family protein
LLDRIDLHVEVTPVGFNDLSDADSVEASATIRDGVLHAREKQNRRFEDQTGIYANAQMDSDPLKKICGIEKSGTVLLKLLWKNLTYRQRPRIAF